MANFHPIRCLSTTSATSRSTSRRTANYQPTIWDDSYIQSVPIDFMDNKYIHLREELKEKVRRMIDQQHDLIEQLELVDALSQLGLGYHFDSEIKDLLSSSSSMENINSLIENSNLHGTALLFRLLREHGINNDSIPRWWRNLGLVCEELNFARDRLVENYLWAMGFTFQPEFRRSRKAITKFNSFVTTIDDIYDVYGTLDELKLFTNAIEEWKIDTGLPNYMKLYLIALFNTVNDIASSFSMEKGLDILPCLKRVWADLCKAYLLEATWYNNGYTPTMDEYLENAWVTISGICVVTTAYCLSDDLTIEALNNLEFYPAIVHHSCMLCRLYNDLGTTTEEMLRGDVPKSIQCYMKEKNVSESIARDYIKCLIRNYWKKLNQECTRVSKFAESPRKVLVDIPRTAQCFYQYGDGYGESNHKTRDQIISLIIEPIPL